MSTPNDGGPAFPRPDSLCSEGMSLRDYFAGQAILGLVHCADAPTRLNPNEIAEAAYRIAEALLARRGKGGVA